MVTSSCFSSTQACNRKTKRQTIALVVRYCVIEKKHFAIISLPGIDSVFVTVARCASITAILAKKKRVRNIVSGFILYCGFSHKWEGFPIIER